MSVVTPAMSVTGYWCNSWQTIAIAAPAAVAMSSLLMRRGVVRWGVGVGQSLRCRVRTQQSVAGMKRIFIGIVAAMTLAVIDPVRAQVGQP